MRWPGRREFLGVPLLEWLLARKPNNLLILVVLLVPIGTLGYMAVEGMSVLDAVYQTMITLSTVGYSDLTTTTAGRVFSVFFMAVGVGVFVVTLSLLAAYLVEGRLREAIGRRRMERDIAQLRDHIIICGFGRFGQYVASEFDRHGVTYAVLEIDENKVTHAEEEGRLALPVDATEEASLLRGGLLHARGVVSTLGSDAANVYVALTAKEIRPDATVVTMARDHGAESKLRRAGADYVVSPYTIGAMNMARRIARPHLARFLDSTRGLKVKMEEIEVSADSALAGVALKDTPLRQRYGVTVVAVVKTQAEDVHYNPPPDLVLEAGDVLVAVGSPDGIEGVGKECAGPGQS